MTNAVQLHKHYSIKSLIKIKRHDLRVTYWFCVRASENLLAVLTSSVRWPDDNVTQSYGSERDESYAFLSWGTNCHVPWM